MKVAAGHTKTLTVKLAKRWTKLLVRKRKLKVLVAVTPHAQAASARKTTRTIKVTAPKRRG